MSFVRRYAAALVLSVLALFFNIVHYNLELMNPESGTRAYWLNTTVENLQSEVWQIAIAAFIFQHFRWQGSPEAQEGIRNNWTALLAPLAVVVLFLLLLKWVVHP